MKKLLVFIAAVAVLAIVSFVFADTLVRNVFGGRVRFPNENVGRYLTMEDGGKFRVFRRLKIDSQGRSDTEAAVFKVRFQFKNFSPSTNRRLSMIQAPFLMGMKGFEEKYWTYDESTGYFQGIYQWESESAALKYPGSFIYKLMTKRSVKGSLSYEIIPNTDLSQYVEKLASHPDLKR